MIEYKEDFEKVADIMKYLYYSCYHWENELRQAENNLLHCPRNDVYGVIEYFLESKRRKKCMTVFLRIYQKFCIIGRVDIL